MRFLVRRDGEGDGEAGPRAVVVDRQAEAAVKR
jgi:hypothetical protein